MAEVGQGHLGQDHKSAVADAERSEGRRRGGLPWLLVGLLSAFLLGLLGSPLAERQARSLLPATFREADRLPPDPRLDRLAQQLELLEIRVREMPEQPADPVAPSGSPAPALDRQSAADGSADAGLADRVDALSVEVARMATQLDGSDARVRDLFLLSVARRMLEAGRPLTPVLEPVRLQFRGIDAAAVEALEAWSVAPQTRSTLRTRLEALRPAPALQGNLLERLGARLAGLVRARGEGGLPAGMDLESQIKEAQDQLRAGDLELAIAAFRGGGEAPEPREWIADAKLVLAAENALDRLEADALARAIAVARTHDSGGTQTPAPVLP